MIYLDNNATTQPDPKVIAAMVRALEESWGNPSSRHRVGERARGAVEGARAQVAQVLGCAPGQVTFTSGGTESCHLAIHSALSSDPRRTRLVTSRTEHSAVRGAAEAWEAQGHPVTWIEGDRNGVIDLAVLDALLDAHPDTGLVSIQWANNETGVVQDVGSLGETCRRHGVPFHVDGTQWVGKMPTDLRSLPIDLLSCSAHKFHGPKGVGALAAAPGVVIRPAAVGGPQERGLRAGTENVPGIVGMGVSADLALQWLTLGEGPRLALAAVRDAFEEKILAALPFAQVIGGGAARLPNTSNIAFARLEAEAVLVALSRRGLCASAGAACSSGSLDPSPVILALGIPREIAHGAVRFSFGRDATEAEARDAAAIVIECVGKVARSMPGAALSS